MPVGERLDLQRSLHYYYFLTEGCVPGPFPPPSGPTVNFWHAGRGPRATQGGSGTGRRVRRQGKPRGVLARQRSLHSYYLSTEGLRPWAHPRAFRALCKLSTPGPVSPGHASAGADPEAGAGARGSRGAHWPSNGRFGFVPLLSGAPQPTVTQKVSPHALSWRAWDPALEKLGRIGLRRRFREALSLLSDRRAASLG